jgi:polyisoprenoid-binding protein YceI
MFAKLKILNQDLTRLLAISAVSIGTALTAMPANIALADTINVPSGTYVVDPTHASIVWRVSHLGLAKYTARFNRFDATIDFNVEDPAASSVQVSIDPTSVDTDYPNIERKDFNAELAQETKFFNAGEFPAITFTSTDIDVTGDRTGAITGDLTMLGVTRPVTLAVTMNGYLEQHPFANVPAIGFSGVTTVKRSDWGFDWGLQVVGDEVEVLIEAEFLKAE